MRRELTYPNLSEGRVAAYSAGEQGPGGSVFRDQDGSNHGTLTNGPTWVNDEGPALSFDGVDDVVTVPFDFLPPPLTLSVWAKHTIGETPDTYRGILCRGGVFDNDTNFALGFRGSLNHINCYWRNGASVYGSEGGSWVQNKWNHVVAIIFKNGDLSVYLAGNLIFTDTGNSLPTDGGQNLTIGSPNTVDGNDDPFTGQIDDVNIYSRALAPQEIATLAKRRGIAYEMDRRIVGAQAVAAAGLLPITQAYMRTRC